MSKMDLRLALVVRRSLPIFAVCLFVVFHCCMPTVTGQLDWTDDDDDPGEYHLIALTYCWDIGLLIFSAVSKSRGDAMREKGINS